MRQWSCFGAFCQMNTSTIVLTYGVPPREDKKHQRFLVASDAISVAQRTLFVACVWGTPAQALPGAPGRGGVLQSSEGPHLAHS